jgi:hypothetical protein
VDQVPVILTNRICGGVEATRGYHLFEYSLKQNKRSSINEDLLLVKVSKRVGFVLHTQFVISFLPGVHKQLYGLDTAKFPNYLI